MSDLNLVIKYENGNIKEVANKAEKEISKAGDKSGEGFSKGFSKGIPSILGAVAKVGAAVGAIGAVVLFKSVQAAQEQEDAVNRLGGALRAAGDFSQGALTDFENFASGLQKVTTVGDEVALQQLALAKGFGATNEQAKEIVKSAADLSVALGIDLNSATRNVAKTLGGYGGELGEVIPELKNFTTEQLKSGAAIGLIAGKFKGLAENELQTFSGSLKQATNSFGDLLENIGSLVTQNPLFAKVLKGAQGLFENISKSIKNFINGGGINTLNESLRTVGLTINKFIVKPFEILFNVGKILFNAFRVQTAAIRQGILKFASAIEETTGAFSLLSRIGSVVFGGLKNGINLAIAGVAKLAQGVVKFVGLFTDVSGLEKTVDDLAKGAFANLEESTNNVNKEIDELFSKGNGRKPEIEAAITLASDINQGELDSAVLDLNNALNKVLDTTTSDGIKQKVNDLFDSIKETITEKKEPIAEQVAEIPQQFNTLLDIFREESGGVLAGFFSGVGSGFEQFGAGIKRLNAQTLEANATIGKFARQSGNTLRNGFGTAAASAFNAFGKALATGENSLKSFGKAFLAQIGTTLSSLGQAFILEGAGYLFSANPVLSAKGPGLIAAGAAMATFGGIIGGSAGASGGASSSAGPTGNSPAFAGETGTIEDDFLGDSQVQAETQTAINITVEGNAFGAEEFTRQIVESIGEEGGKQGLVFNNFQTA